MYSIINFSAHGRWFLSTHQRCSGLRNHRTGTKGSQYIHWWWAFPKGKDAPYERGVFVDCNVLWWTAKCCRPHLLRAQHLLVIIRTMCYPIIMCWLCVLPYTGHLYWGSASTIFCRRPAQECSHQSCTHEPNGEQWTHVTYAFNKWFPSKVRPFNVYSYFTTYVSM